jgi:hypothetical protein
MRTPEVGRRTILVVCASFLLVAALFYFSRSSSRIPDSLPARLSNEEFWSMVKEFSEPGGYFRSDNFLSNESGSQYVIPNLRRSVRSGGVYLGVGPEQNFTYILALESRMAFIVDIRRQNMLEHLLYKAFMETSQDRAEFLSRLFARPRPEAMKGDSSVDALFTAYEMANESTGLFEANLNSALKYLESDKGFGLSAEDEGAIRHVYEAFAGAGPNMRYTFLGGYGGSMNMPTYADLMTENDGSHNWSYLATEEQFRTMQRLQKNNLVVPLVGDFAGPKALRAVGQYLKLHGAVLDAFYTSNVEQYLFQDDRDWRFFYENVATLPVNANSTFIRYIINGASFNRRFRALLSPMANIVKAYNNGQVQSYYDVIEMSR